MAGICGHIRQVAFGKREKQVHFLVVAAKLLGNIYREGGLCRVPTTWHLQTFNTEASDQ